MDADLRAALVETFRWLDPGPHSTHLVSDLSGWWRDPALLARLGGALAGLFPAAPAPTVVISPEATGFLLGPLVAVTLGAGFVEGHKDTRDRRVPDAMHWGTSTPDYRGRTLRLGVRAARLRAGDRALIVDDWIVTGAQVGALRAALGRAGVEVVGAAVVVDGCPPPVGAALGVRGLLRAAELPG
ncbi:MAG TPA: phosphoribosyltransferase family protein [Pilimelia sp.]|nr:phosphoribosyltransferase family protein [Pilimelia sp.]